MNSINHAWPNKIPRKPDVCPGCGRCNTCGRGPYVAPYPYYPQPHYPNYSVWISTGTTTTGWNA